MSFCQVFRHLVHSPAVHNVSDKALTIATILFLLKEANRVKCSMSVSWLELITEFFEKWTVSCPVKRHICLCQASVCMPQPWFTCFCTFNMVGNMYMNYKD